MCVPNHRRAGTGAFTLIELLAALAILSIIVLVALNMFSLTANTTLRGNNQMERNQSARAVLGLICRDLERTVNLSTAVNMFEIQNGETVSGLAITNTALYFLADLSGAQNPYGVVNVGYQMMTTNYAGSARWVLARGADPLVDTTTHPADWFITGVAPGYWQVASENILGLAFSYYTDSSTVVAPPWNTGTIPNPLPQSIVVTVWAIDTPSYNQALSVDPNLTSAGSLAILERNVTKYERRVFLPRSTQN